MVEMGGGWLSQLRKVVENGFPPVPVDGGVGGGGVIVVYFVARIFIMNLLGANRVAIEVALQENVVLLRIVLSVLLLDVQNERLKLVEVVVVEVVVVNCKVVGVGVVVSDVCVCATLPCAKGVIV